MSFEQMMIHYSAPTLCGIKPGNLFFIKKEDFSRALFRKWKGVFARYGIAVVAVKNPCGGMTVLAYNVLWLENILRESSAMAYLQGKGYRSCPDVPAVISLLVCRMEKGGGFPHEVGVVLGYPVRDVIEFERQAGRNCKYCGYWKSYSDVESAKECECRYRVCSCMCKKWFDEGYSLPRIIEEYKKAVKAA